MIDPLLRAAAAVGILLLVATVIGQIGARRAPGAGGWANYNARVGAWWVMVAVVFVALWWRPLGTVVLLGLLSFLALREFVTLTYTRYADHRTLFWAFFVITPLQYLLVAIDWYGLFAILIPVYGFAFTAIRSALRGDPQRYLQRTATIQWGLMTCVYALSHLAALVRLRWEGHAADDSWMLILWVIAVAQLSDVMQYVWGKTLGRTRLAPHLSPNKTWEGLIGGIASATAIGWCLRSYTPYPARVALAMALVITVLGFFGGLVMSAIKRDAGIKDFGNLLPGHGGVLDRVDSLIFTAPVVFHLTRYFFGAAPP